MLSVLLVALPWLAVTHAADLSLQVIVDHEKGDALAVPRDHELSFSWQLPADSGSAQQASYQIQIVDSKDKLVWDSGVVSSDRSDNVPYSGPELAPGQKFCASVTAIASATTEGSRCFWSAPSLQGAAAIWAKDSTQKALLLRGVFDAPAIEQQHVLHLTAKPVPTRPPNKGSAASKLLCAYKAWLNGMPLAAGPGHPTGPNSTIEDPALLYDSLDVTPFLRATGNVLAIEAFYWSSSQDPLAHDVPTDLDDAGGVLALLQGPLGVVAATGGSEKAVGEWLSYDAADAYLVTQAVVKPHGRYDQPQEAWDLRQAPPQEADWRSPDFEPDSSAWSAPMRRSLGQGAFGQLRSKRGKATRLSNIPSSALRFTMLEGDKCKSGYCYIVDMTREIQGGLNISFANGKEGQLVEVFSGETLNPDGMVLPQVDRSTTLENAANWTLRDGVNRIVQHEYLESRYWQVNGAPEPPRVGAISAWEVMYDSVSDPKSEGLSTFQSSSSNLDAVWDLSAYTLRVGTMDVNTDSNTRQRDNCNLDSYLQQMGQSAVAPLAALPYLRRNAAFLQEPDSLVHGWAEFELSSLDAIHQYTMESGDLSLASFWFDKLKAQNSLLQFVSTDDGLVHKDPKEEGYTNLIDWPHATDIHADTEGEMCCQDGHEDGEVSTTINSHVVRAARRLAALGALLGRPAEELMELSQTAEHVAVSIVAAARREAEDCQPAGVGPCFRDSLGSNHTSTQATMYVLGNGLLPANETLEFLPFLKARNSPYPQFSAQSSNWIFEALYRMAAARQDATDAADYAFELLTREGHRSWMEMLANNATMTIEHWWGVAGGDGHTWSHPWSAAPARAIVAGLMGLRPLEPAYRRVSVHPQPPTGERLIRAAVSLPTPRGKLALSFDRADAGFEMQLTVPGNTLAEVCFPASAWPTPPSRPRILIDGAEVSAAWRGGQACLTEDVTAGRHVLQAPANVLV